MFALAMRTFEAFKKEMTYGLPQLTSVRKACTILIFGWHTRTLQTTLQVSTVLRSVLKVFREVNHTFIFPASFYPSIPLCPSSVQTLFSSAYFLQLERNTCRCHYYYLVSLGTLVIWCLSVWTSQHASWMSDFRSVNYRWREATNSQQRCSQWIPVYMYEFQ